VLAGGAARGAYEVGVVQYILEEVARDVGDAPLDVLCGTSVGAINACALAAWADDPRGRAARLAEHWETLRIEHVVRPDGREILGLVQSFFRLGRTNPRLRRGGILDPAGLARLLAAAVPFHRIDDHLRAGRLKALSVSTTHIATGRTVVFVQRVENDPPLASRDPTLVPQLTTIGLPHALASAAIPLLFPAVVIDDEYYCDGGLRQNVPLSPARRLGADRLIVVSPRALADRAPASVQQARVQSFPSPLFLVGKTLNALLLDRIDADLDRMNRINEILAAGERLYGAGFVPALNKELGREPGRQVRPMRVELIRASHDIGVLAAQFVRSAEFASRSRGVIGRVLRRLADGESASETDLLSYLLFDGGFARQLIELGRADARAKHDSLCAFFGDGV
jgi:NTE family protein